MTTINLIPSDDQNPFPITEQVINYLGAVKGLAAVSQGDIKVPIRKAVLQRIVEFGQISDHKEVKVAKVTTNDLKTSLSGSKQTQLLFQFLSKYKNDEGLCYSKDLAEVFKAACHLQCKPLMSLIGLVVATIIFFDNSSDSYQERKTALGVKGQVTTSDYERYINIYR